MSGRRLIALVAALWLTATCASAQTLQNTTLTADVTATGTSFSVLSSTGMLAGWWLMVDRETTIIRDVVGTTITVQRDYAGLSSNHVSGAFIYYGPPFYFHTSTPSSEACLVSSSEVPFVNAYTGTAWTCRHSIWQTLTVPGVMAGSAIMGSGAAGPLITTALSQSNSMPTGVAVGSVLTSNGIGVSGVWSPTPAVTSLSASLITSGGYAFSGDNNGDVGGANRARTGYFGTSLAMGTSPAATGMIRLPNATNPVNGAITARNAAGNGDILVVGLYNDNQIYMGGTGTSVGPNNSNAQDLGFTANTWRTGFFGTSVVTPLLKSPAGPGLTLGTADNTAVVFIQNNTNVLALNGVTLYPINDNAVDLGAISPNRYRTGYFGTSLFIGTNPATGGSINLPNVGYIQGRNAANSANLSMLGYNVTNQLLIGDTAVQAMVYGDALLMGPGTVASAGEIRFVNNGLGLQARNVGNTGNIGMITTGAGDEVIVGYNSSGDIFFKPANVEKFRIATTGLVTMPGSIALATNPATVGALRVANNDGVVSRNNANTANNYLIYQNTLDNIVIGSVASNVIPGITTSTLGNTTSTWDYGYFGSALVVGTNPATVGWIRGPNNGKIQVRNAANTVDANVALYDTNDDFWYADTTGRDTNLLTGRNLILGTGITGDIKWGKALVALGAGAAPTFGTIGGTGPATAAQNSWMRVMDSAGVAFWVPAWK